MSFWQFLQDGKGRFSSARLINVAVCIAAIFIGCWLTYNDKMTEGYFLALLAYGAGVQGVGKFAETRRKPEE